MERDWPCRVIESYLIRPIPVQPTCDVEGFPRHGKGDRSLFCDQYERCLDFAIGHNWESFNCQNCTYERKGQISFHFDSFKDIEIDDENENEDEICLCSEDIIDQLLVNRANQEDLLIMIIDGGMIDG